MTDDKLLILRALSTLRQVRDAQVPKLELLPSFHELIEDLTARLAAAEPERQGLTDEDAAEIERWVEFKEEGSGRVPTGKLIRYIEAKLREKNT